MNDIKIIESEYLRVKDGDILTFDVLTWQHEGYEFGRPCLMLSPLIREDSDADPEQLIETACIDLVVDGKAIKNNEQQQIKWRGWNLKYLRRVFNEALIGHKFPIAGYRAERKYIKFYINKRKQLDFCPFGGVQLINL